MDWLVALSLALSGLIGFALGIFGGGGSILAVPMLVFVTRVAPSAAIGMSLAIVGATSLVAGYAHHRQGQVRLKVALSFGVVAALTIAAVLGAVLGERTGRAVSIAKLRLGFAAFVIAVGIAVAGSSINGGVATEPTMSENPTARMSDVEPTL